MVEIRQFDAAAGRAYLGALAAVLVDCVEGGASVSFMAPFPVEAAEAFFRKALDEVELGHRILLAAFIDTELVGTVQIVMATPPNQPHRADVAKLLVLRSARGHGIGQRLMEQVEEVSWSAGKTLLVLDTVTGESGERLYRRMGWTAAGVIPDYALFPDGRFCDTTIFWKKLGATVALPQRRSGIR
ncbi:MAG TPA: GNAT family N-acetyltransferase [Bryobacteraceae bacterium]|nr:GNAT family N-acetyltransferase [Bryobacteraceae bacterium]